MTSNYLARYELTLPVSFYHLINFEVITSWNKKKNIDFEITGDVFG